MGNNYGKNGEQLWGTLFEFFFYHAWSSTCPIVGECHIISISANVCRNGSYCTLIYYYFEVSTWSQSWSVCGCDDRWPHHDGIFNLTILLSLTCNISLWQLLWTACVIDLSLVNISTYWTSTRQRLVSRLLVVSKSYAGVITSYVPSIVIDEGPSLLEHSVSLPFFASPLVICSNVTD